MRRFQLVYLQLLESNDKFEAFQVDKIERSELLKFEAKVRDVESKLDLEKAARAHAVGQLEKFKEQVVILEQVFCSSFAFVFALLLSSCGIANFGI